MGTIDNHSLVHNNHSGKDSTTEIQTRPQQHLPSAYLLGRSARQISIQLRGLPDGLGPTHHLALELVQERRVKD